MISLFKLVVSTLILFSLVGCSKENAKTKNKGPYKIDSIAYSLYDLNSDTVFYNYTYLPNVDAVFESVTRRNDTTIYLSKSTYLNEINRQSTVVTKNNRIIKTQYLQPIGIYAQDGLVLHNYYFYNTNDRVDSFVHIFYSIHIDYPALDTFRETYLVGDLFFDTTNFSFSSYANQKSLIGLDVNEFILIFYNIIYTNESDDYLYGNRDDIREFSRNCLVHNFNTLNTNFEHLFNKISGFDIVYTFDSRYNNRIKEIDFYLGSKKYQHFSFNYQQ